MAVHARREKCIAHMLFASVLIGMCCAKGGPSLWRRKADVGIPAGVQRLRGGGWFIPIAQLPTQVVGSVVDKVKHGREASRDKEVQDACRNLEDKKCASKLRELAAKGYNLR